MQWNSVLLRISMQSSQALAIMQSVGNEKILNYHLTWLSMTVKIIIQSNHSNYDLNGFFISEMWRQRTTTQRCWYGWKIWRICVLIDPLNSKSEKNNKISSHNLMLTTQPTCNRALLWYTKPFWSLFICLHHRYSILRRRSKCWKRIINKKDSNMRATKPAWFPKKSSLRHQN